MNSYTKDIMKILNIDADTAMKVQYNMMCNGIDFSECTSYEFKVEAREAYKELLTAA